jgi:hypothetical protein
MSSSKLWPAVVILLLLSLSRPAQTSGNRPPRSVLDYYLLLPHKYLPFLPTDSLGAREAAIRIKDLEAGFLQSGEETEEVSTTMVLFKKSDGSDLIAIENRSCLGACSSNLSLLRYGHDRWFDITSELLPTLDEREIQASLERQYAKRANEPSRQPWLMYTLRRDGASIEINEYLSGMVLGEFEWSNDVFVFKSEEAVGGKYGVLATTDNPAGDHPQIIGIDPEIPASLPINGHLRIKIAYELKSAQYCFIRVRPVIMEERPDEFTSGSMRYKPGSGVTTAYFGFNNQAHIDSLKVVMVDEKQKPILTLLYNVDASWKGIRNCPKFQVDCFPDIDYSGAVLACKVYPSGVRPGQELTYRWSLSTGVIASGQGTRRIVVNLANTDAETMKAEVEAGNLGPNCEKTASFTMPLSSFVKSKERK